MMPQVLEHKLLVVVLLLFIDVEVGAVEIEQAMGELVASERAHDQITLVTIVHATAREAASWRSYRPLFN